MILPASPGRTAMCAGRTASEMQVQAALVLFERSLEKLWAEVYYSLV